MAGCYDSEDKSEQNSRCCRWQTLRNIHGCTSRIARVSRLFCVCNQAVLGMDPLECLLIEGCTPFPAFVSSCLRAAKHKGLTGSIISGLIAAKKGLMLPSENMFLYNGGKERAKGGQLDDNHGSQNRRSRPSSSSFGLSPNRGCSIHPHSISWCWIPIIIFSLWMACQYQYQVQAGGTPLFYRIAVQPYLVATSNQEILMQNLHQLPDTATPCRWWAFPPSPGIPIWSHRGPHIRILGPGPDQGRCHSTSALWYELQVVSEFSRIPCYFFETYIYIYICIISRFF